MPFLPTASSGASWHDFVKGRLEKPDLASLREATTKACLEQRRERDLAREQEARQREREEEWEWER
jgi:hypothetical protein